MLGWYKKVVLAILHFFNYSKIENENGSSHFALNICDLGLALLYAGIRELRLQPPFCLLVLLINLITLTRLMLGNLKKSINLRDKYTEKYLRKPGLSYKSAYDLKLVIEFCVIAFSLMPYWVQGLLFEDHVIRTFAGISIILSFLENYINIHVELFRASIEV